MRNPSNLSERIWIAGVSPKLQNPDNPQVQRCDKVSTAAALCNLGRTQAFAKDALLHVHLQFKFSCSRQHVVANQESIKGFTLAVHPRNAALLDEMPSCQFCQATALLMQPISISGGVVQSLNSAILQG